jgi:hypothetical protein
LTGLTQKQLSQVSVDVPVALLIGIGQCAPVNWPAQAQMITMSGAKSVAQRPCKQTDSSKKTG